MNAVVMTVGAGVADLKLLITNNSGMSVPSSINETPQGYQTIYVPTEPGTYSIFVTYGGIDVPGSILTYYYYF